MATLGDMRTRIARELQINATTFAVDIDAAIFSAIKFYQHKDFDFLQATPVNVLLTATAVYPLETLIPDRSSVRNIELQYNRDQQPLKYRTPGEFADIQSGFTGDPVYWSIFDDSLYIEPVPALTFTAKVWYSASISLTASATASNVWTNEAEELIRLHAEVDLLANRIKDYTGAGQAQGRLQMIFDNLNERTVVRQSSRRLRPHL